MKPWLRALAICLALRGDAFAEERWTEFRGPAGTGHSASTGLPHEWSETKNHLEDAHPRPRLVVAGRARKAGLAHDRQRDGRKLSVLALDRDSGRVLHDILLFKVEQPEDTARFNSFASPTPVIEDGRVYVHFGSYGTAAIDTRTGKTIWARRFVTRGIRAPARTGRTPNI